MTGYARNRFGHLLTSALDISDTVQRGYDRGIRVLLLGYRGLLTVSIAASLGES